MGQSLGINSAAGRQMFREEYQNYTADELTADRCGTAAKLHKWTVQLEELEAAEYDAEIAFKKTQQHTEFHEYCAARDEVLDQKPQFNVISELHTLTKLLGIVYKQRRDLRYVDAVDKLNELYCDEQYGAENTYMLQAKWVLKRYSKQSTESA